MLSVKNIVAVSRDHRLSPAQVILAQRPPPGTNSSSLVRPSRGSVIFIEIFNTEDIARTYFLACRPRFFAAAHPLLTANRQKEGR